MYFIMNIITTTGRKNNTSLVICWLNKPGNRSAIIKTHNQTLKSVKAMEFPWLIGAEVIIVTGFIVPIFSALRSDNISFRL